VAKTVAGADTAITIKFKIQFINDGIHQLARRFAKDLVGWFELLAFAEKLKWQDRAWHILCHIGPRTAHFNLKAVFNTGRKATISPCELTRAGFFALPALASA
jgi:hypothetical protein